MNKKINPVNGVEIDPMFDGHIEKPLSQMTPKEKLDYLWLQTVFKWKVKTKVKRVNKAKEIRINKNI
jgi:hypothetical protein